MYEGGRQFSHTGTLVKTIKKAWATISLNEIKKYYDSLPNRMFEVIKKKGGHTKYQIMLKHCLLLFKLSSDLKF